MFSKTPRLFLCCFAIFILAWIPSVSVLANSIQPPAAIWFKIENDAADASKIINLKIIGCALKDCSETDAVYSSDEKNSYGNMLVHLGNLYYWRFWPGAMKLTPHAYKIIIQFEDGTKISNAIDDMPPNYGSEASYRVIVRKNDLLAQRIPDLAWPGLHFNLEAFLLTLISESLVGAALLGAWKKLQIRDILLFAGVITFTNLISYPVLWNFFLSIAQFHYKSDEGSGRIFLVFGLIFPLLVISAVNLTNESRFFFACLALLAIPASCFLCGLMGGKIYGVDTVLITEGLSVKTAILLIEICAVFYETLLLYGLSRKKYALPQMFIVSLIANLASLGLSLLIYNPFA